MNAAQDRAFVFLTNYYGDARIAKTYDDGDVKIEGIDEDEDVRCRWVVRPDGRVGEAWDPDYALDRYKEDE